MPQVFISYSHKDAEFVSKLRTDLQNKGITCWIDVDSIAGGANWQRSIAAGIQASEVMVVCLSPDAVESEYVAQEISFADIFNKQIIPIMKKNCLEEIRQNPTTERLLDLQIIIFEDRYEAGLSKLISAILGKEVACALDKIFKESGGAEFRSMIEQRISVAQKIILSGIGLNILANEPFALAVMQRAANHECTLEIFLANPLNPSVQTRLIEEETGKMTPPVGKDGLLARLRTFLDIWERLERPENVSINLINHYPTFAYLIVDDEYFFYPYGYTELGNFSPVLQFSGSNSKAEYFKDFIDKHHDRLKKSTLDTRMTQALLCEPDAFQPQDLKSLAVYFIPPENSSLYQFGTNVLGYDLRNQESISSAWQQYVGPARDFGFHLTVCDVLYFPNEAETKMVEAEIRFLLKEFSPFLITNIQLTRAFPDENSFALVLEDQSGSLEALHHELVFRVYRRAIGSNYSFGLNKPNRDHSYPRNRLMTRRYQAPYVLSSYRPHFTLLTQVPLEDQLDVYERLGKTHAEQMNDFSVRIDRLAIVHQPKWGAPWEIKNKEILLGR